MIEAVAWLQQPVPEPILLQEFPSITCFNLRGIPEGQDVLWPLHTAGRGSCRQLQAAEPSAPLPQPPPACSLPSPQLCLPQLYLCRVFVQTPEVPSSAVILCPAKCWAAPQCGSEHPSALEGAFTHVLLQQLPQVTHRVAKRQELLSETLDPSAGNPPRSNTACTAPVMSPVSSTASAFPTGTLHTMSPKQTDSVLQTGPFSSPMAASPA